MKLKMLIVEDEEALLDLLKFNFNKEGYKIDTAMDGETASVSYTHLRAHET